MKRLSRTRLGQFLIGVLIVAGAVGVYAVGSTVDPPADPKAAAPDAAKLEPVAGTKLNKVTLTAEAARRLGIQTAPVGTVQVGGKAALVVPYSAVLYDSAGATWVFTATAPLSYVRQAVTVESIRGESATLSQGPAAGTTIVVVGAAELYGTELRVGGDG